MTISSQTIDTIKRDISPVQAIEYYTGYPGQRGRWTCPFHNDKHPSISVKGDKWTCWACGASGDVIDFTQRFHSIGFREAIAKLGEDFGVPVEVECTGKTDPAAQEKKILADIDRKNRQQYRAWRDAEINKLIICRRVLMQHNAPEWEIEMYDKEIDELVNEGR